MKSLIRGLLILSTLSIFSIIGFAQNGVDGANGPITEQTSKGGMATLYAQDPLMQSFCFRDGGAGHVFQQNEVRNRCSDINYHSYYAEQFAVGIEGARLGVIVDLGTTDDLKKEYGYEETVGAGQGFASIHLENGKLVILKDRRSQEMQELKESLQVFEQPTSTAKASVKVGHIYLARISEKRNPNAQVLVKLLVVGHVPGESVTFRWQSL
jgi:hypothetical protein